jgi:hypothetical protein
MLSYASTLPLDVSRSGPVAVKISGHRLLVSGARRAGVGLFVPKPSTPAVCQRRSTCGLRQTVRACPLASTLSVAIVTHFVTRSLASRS